jgi:hypothetical protein
MATVVNKLAHLRQLLVDHCDFNEGLFEDNYQLGGRRTVDWAGFAHRPFDARSACVAAFAVQGQDPRQAVLDRRLLGAPVVFALGEDHYEVWRPGRDGATAVQQSISAREINGFIQEHKADLNRVRLYQAKTAGRLPESDRQLRLFVDPGVLLYAESELGQQLTSAVLAAVELLANGKKRVTDWVFKAAFRLLAAKILKDKRVPHFLSANLLDVDASLQRVERHYGSRDRLAITHESQRTRLVEAVRILNQLGDLRNLTTEALADVYERALITKETRKVHGTHKTPAYLVDYVVWQLADWIAEIPVKRLRVFEPACGHAPFLVSAMRLLRTLDLHLPVGEMGAFLRERLVGIETDAFALEIARLSLTVADEPNPDGWDGLVNGDMFVGDYLESTAKSSTVLLANPPFEQNKAYGLLERTLPCLPMGAVFGVVAPATFLFSDKKRPKQLREWLVSHCQLGEVSLFPDGLFSFADQECTILLGRRLPDGAATRSMHTRLRRVREPDREGFVRDYTLTTSRIESQSRLAEQPDAALWIPEFDEEIWSWLRHLPKLESIATVNQGMQYKGTKSRRKNSKTVEDKPFPGSIEGFDILRGNWFLHEHPRIRHFNVDDSVISRPRSGLDRVLQVLVNHSPMGRGKWRLRPFIDRARRVFASSLISVRPLSAESPLQYIWALLGSPVAQFYAYCFMLKRNIHTGILGAMPIPDSGETDVLRISRKATEYLDAARRRRTLFEQRGVQPSHLSALLQSLDAEILRLYDLPAHAERFLLDQFAGEQRSGVPVSFSQYYPTDFKADVLLYAYLSEPFQRALRGEPPELTDEQERRYDELVARSDAATLSPAEADELHRLQADVDGRDYALQMAQETGPGESPERRRSADAQLKRLDDRLASAMLREPRNS